MSCIVHLTSQGQMHGCYLQVSRSRNNQSFLRSFKNSWLWIVKISFYELVCEYIHTHKHTEFVFISRTNKCSLDWFLNRVHLSLFSVSKYRSDTYDYTTTVANYIYIKFSLKKGNIWIRWRKVFPYHNNMNRIYIFIFIFFSWNVSQVYLCVQYIPKQEKSYDIYDCNILRKANSFTIRPNVFV